MVLYTDYHTQKTIAFYAANSPIGPAITHQERMAHARTRSYRTTKPVRTTKSVRSDIDNIIEDWDRSRSSTKPDYFTPDHRDDRRPRNSGSNRDKQTPQQRDNHDIQVQPLLTTAHISEDMEHSPSDNATPSHTGKPVECLNCHKQYTTRDCGSLSAPAKEHSPPLPIAVSTAAATIIARHRALFYSANATPLQTAHFSTVQCLRIRPAIRPQTRLRHRCFLHGILRQRQDPQHISPHTTHQQSAHNRPPPTTTATDHQHSSANPTSATVTTIPPLHAMMATT